MERKTRKKWILGIVAVVILSLAAFVTFEVISFNRDMKELGRGLNELAEGLSKLNFSADSTSAASDTAHVNVDSLSTVPRKD